MPWCAATGLRTPELMLVAVPFMTKQTDTGNDGDLDLLVLDSGNLQIHHR